MPVISLVGYFLSFAHTMAEEGKKCLYLSRGKREREMITGTDLLKPYSHKRQSRLEWVVKREKESNFNDSTGREKMMTCG